MSLGDIINLERVNIVEEAEDFYKVQYKGQEYQVMKSAETHFANGSASAQSLRQAIRLEQILIHEAGIFQDTEVPNEFKEVMMFHEIRESEYKNAGFADGHERAVNDEVLYALKFFTPKQRKAYFEFAEKYRAQRTKVPTVRLDESIQSCVFALFYRNRDISKCLGEDTGVRLIVLNDDVRFDQRLMRLRDQLVDEYDLCPASNVCQSRVALKVVIDEDIKWYLEAHDRKVIVVDNDPARLAHIAKILGVVTIDANQQDVEKRMYETCKALMKKPE